MSHDLKDLLDRTAARPGRPADVDRIRTRGRQIRARRRIAGTSGAVALAVVASVLIAQLPSSVEPRIDERPDVAGDPSGEPTSHGAVTPTTGPTGDPAAWPAGEIVTEPAPGQPAVSEVAVPDDACPQVEGEVVSFALSALDDTAGTTSLTTGPGGCAAVTPGQQVRLVHPAGSEDGATITASLGEVLVELEPGEQVTLDQPVSHYLATGVHTIGTNQDAPGPRIWVLDTPAQSAGEQAILDALVAFAASPSDATFADLPLEETVQLGLGADILDEVAAGDLRDPVAWQLDVEDHAGYEGPFSALTTLEDAPDELAFTAGPHPHCAGPPRPAPVGLDDLRRLSIQPGPGSLDSCIGWFSVDLFVDDDQRIVAGTLDLWEP